MPQKHMLEILQMFSLLYGQVQHLEVHLLPFKTVKNEFYCIRTFPDGPFPYDGWVFNLFLLF